MTRRAVAGLVLAILVVLAGCGAGTTPTSTAASSTPSAVGSQTATKQANTVTPTRTPTPTATPTPNQGKVSVSGEALGVDPTPIWNRVQTVMGVDLEGAPHVSVNTLDDLRERRRQRARVTGTTFFDAMGIRTPENPIDHLDQDFGGVTYPSGSVELYIGENATDDEVRCLLAHEFAHVVQFERNWDGQLSSALEADDDTVGGVDTALVRRAVLEGSALAVEKAYVERWTDVPPCGTTERQVYRDWYENGSAYSTFLAAPYVLGFEYVESVEADGNRHTEIMGTPPSTTEQLLHPGSDDQPRPLSVSVNVSDSSWYSRGTISMGELVMQTALSANLSLAHAQRAAAGWGKDTLVSFQDVDERGFVWVTRWDDPANASEFETAFETYLGDRGREVNDVWETADGNHWRLVRTTEDTVAVIVGPEPFVSNVTVSGGPEVRIAVSDDDQTES